MVEKSALRRQNDYNIRIVFMLIFASWNHLFYYLFR